MSVLSCSLVLTAGAHAAGAGGTESVDVWSYSNNRFSKTRMSSQATKTYCIARETDDWREEPWVSVVFSVLDWRAHYWLHRWRQDGGTQLDGWFGLNLQWVLAHLTFARIRNELYSGAYREGEGIPRSGAEGERLR